MKTSLRHLGLVAVAILSGCVTTKQGEENQPATTREPGTNFLPNAEASKEVSVTTTGAAPALIVVQTQAVAVKETGPKETVARFGEVYAFSPSFIAVRREEPTRIRFWNLQPDDEHDFMLMDADHNVLMKWIFRPLTETSFVFTFHREGLYDFVCTMHQPEMNGQILVLPPRAPDDQ
jgi:plastocyanin